MSSRASDGDADDLGGDVERLAGGLIPDGARHLPVLVRQKIERPLDDPDPRMMNDMSGCERGARGLEHDAHRGEPVRVMHEVDAGRLAVSQEGVQPCEAGRLLEEGEVRGVDVLGRAGRGGRGGGDGGGLGGEEGAEAVRALGELSTDVRRDELDRDVVLRAGDDLRERER